MLARCLFTLCCLILVILYKITFQVIEEAKIKQRALGCSLRKHNSRKLRRAALKAGVHGRRGSIIKSVWRGSHGGAEVVFSCRFCAAAFSHRSSCQSAADCQDYKRSWFCPQSPSLESNSKTYMPLICWVRG